MALPERAREEAVLEQGQPWWQLKAGSCTGCKVQGAAFGESCFP